MGDLPFFRRAGSIALAVLASPAIVGALLIALLMILIPWLIADGLGSPT